MATGRVSISFLLLEKKIGDVGVIGLSEFWVDPRRAGIGRAALQMIEALGSPKVIVGFAGEETVDFYRSCDWLVGSMHKGKYIVASDSIDESKFDDEIW